VRGEATVQQDVIGTSVVSSKLRVLGVADEVIDIRRDHVSEPFLPESGCHGHERLEVVVIDLVHEPV
jgi:hypothetical protein